MSAKFTKKDLKTGDVILRRNGYVGIVCLETESILMPTGYDYLDWVNDDLTDHGLIDGEGKYDIMAVRRPHKPRDCQFCAFEYEFGELVYER